MYVHHHNILIDCTRLKYRYFNDRSKSEVNTYSFHWLVFAIGYLTMVFISFQIIQNMIIIREANQNGYANSDLLQLGIPASFIYVSSINYF